MEQVSNLITQKLTTMAQATDHPLVSKYKAISTLIPYAVLQERDGRPEMLDTFLRVARASREKGYKWLYVKYIITTLIFKQALVPSCSHCPTSNGIDSLLGTGMI